MMRQAGRRAGAGGVLTTAAAAAFLLLSAGCGDLGSGGSSTALKPAALVEANAGASASAPVATSLASTSAGGGSSPAPPAAAAELSGKLDTRELASTVAVDNTAKKDDDSTDPAKPADWIWMPPQTKPVEEPLAVDVPLGLQPLVPNSVVPAANPMTKAKYELGKQLYFDPRVSKDSTVSCATCHNPDKGWTDNQPTSTGIGGQVGGRSSPTVVNTAYGKTMFWDGRAPSLEGQAQGPIVNPIEMGDQSYKDIVMRLREISGYREQFQKAFGTDVTLDGLAKAIATFERTVLSGNSAYDKYNRGDLKALDESQKRGMVLFGLRLDAEDDFKPDVVLKKANCTSCHVGFNFTDEQFHNLGADYDAASGSFDDFGRIVAEPIGGKNIASTGAFKTPTLRDIAKTGPYLHDGSEKTLEKVVEFYDKGGKPNPYLDKDMKKLNLTDRERADLVAFMKALTGDAVKVELPTLPVGPDGKSPDPRSALKAPSPKAALEYRHVPIVR